MEPKSKAKAGSKKSVGGQGGQSVVMPPVVAPGEIDMEVAVPLQDLMSNMQENLSEYNCRLAELQRDIKLLHRKVDTLRRDPYIREAEEIPHKKMPEKEQDTPRRRSRSPAKPVESQSRIEAQLAQMKEPTHVRQLSHKKHILLRQKCHQFVWSAMM